jgi:hypothetical protein
MVKLTLCHSVSSRTGGKSDLYIWETGVSRFVYLHNIRSPNSIALLDDVGAWCRGRVNLYISEMFTIGRQYMNPTPVSTAPPHLVSLLPQLCPWTLQRSMHPLRLAPPTDSRTVRARKVVELGVLAREPEARVPQRAGELNHVQRARVLLALAELAVARVRVRPARERVGRPACDGAPERLWRRCGRAGQAQQAARQRRVQPRLDTLRGEALERLPVSAAEEEHEDRALRERVVRLGEECADREPGRQRVPVGGGALGGEVRGLTIDSFRAGRRRREEDVHRSEVRGPPEGWVREDGLVEETESDLADRVLPTRREGWVERRRALLEHS